jgi:hypothetical protein
MAKSGEGAAIVIIIREIQLVSLNNHSLSKEICKPREALAYSGLH